MRGLGGSGKRAIIAIVATTLLAVTIAKVVHGQNMLRQPERVIRSQILNEVPLGTGIEEAELKIADRGWKIFVIEKEGGFLHQGYRPSRVVGDMHIRATIGDYRTYFLFDTSVVAFFGFDDSGKLIDVWVWKTIDAL